MKLTSVIETPVAGTRSKFHHGSQPGRLDGICRVLLHHTQTYVVDVVSERWGLTGQASVRVDEPNQRRDQHGDRFITLPEPGFPSSLHACRRRRYDAVCAAVEVVLSFGSGFWLRAICLSGDADTAPACRHAHCSALLI